LDSKERTISHILIQDQLIRNIRPIAHTLRVYKKRAQEDDDSIHELGTGVFGQSSSEFGEDIPITVNN
jgi:hypothetical protein